MTTKSYINANLNIVKKWYKNTISNYNIMQEKELKGTSPKAIAEHMLANDKFSTWLGIEILKASEGYCKVGMCIREEMLNGMGNAHGGISVSLCENAVAFASNNY